MSAICGIWQRTGAPVTDAAIDGMLQALAHRGPDGARYWRRGPVALGHQQCTVTPESMHEALPLDDPALQITLTAATRLDNRDELCDLLAVPVAGRAAVPDSVLLLRSYVRWGQDCVRRFLGAFAFALWDGRSQEFFCAVDPMGERALYYVLRPDRFLFATEIAGILAAPDMPRALNPAHLARLAAPFAEPPAYNETYYAGVQRMLPATSMVVSAAGIRCVEYWQLDPERTLPYRTDAETLDALKEVLFAAVAARTRSIYPMGSLFSGGLDSSAVTAVAATLLADQGRSLTALSAVAEPESADRFPNERAYIDAFEHWSNLDRVFVPAIGRGPFTAPEQVVAAADSPAITPFHYLYTAFGAEARQRGIRVLLDGIGGEFGVSMRGRSILPGHLRRGEWPAVRRVLREQTRTTGRPAWRILLGEGLLPMLPATIQERLRRSPGASLLTVNENSTLRLEFVRAHLGDYEPAWRAQLAAMFDVTQGERPGLLLRLAKARRGLTPDRQLGASGWGQLASPLFDRRVIEFCLAVPDHLRNQHGLNRYLVRGSLQEILPPAIQRRTAKIPFAVDFPLRYNRQRLNVARWLAAIAPGDPVRSVVDVERLQQLAQRSFDERDPSGRKQASLAAMHAMPQGVFLILFLRQFSAYT